jgi:integrase
MSKFIVFLGDLLRNMQSQGRTGTQSTYLATSGSVLAFSGKRSLTLRELFTKDFLHRYQEYLLGRGCCYNTVSSYMRVLRAIRNKAERRKLIATDADLFDKLYTGIEPTRKRAISKEAILKLNDADLSVHPHLIRSRDLFMLLFHLQGMSFIDLVSLRKSDWNGDYITYHRRKTGGLITVKVWPPARELLNRYLNTDETSPNLLSILNTDGEDAVRQYRTALRRLNRHLKSLAGLVGIEENLTTYVARHSWATAAYHIGVPTAIISEAMGHKTEEVTRVYLTSFNTETLDYANKMIWETLFENKQTDKNAKKQNNKKREDLIKDVSFLGRERHRSIVKVKRTSRISKCPVR